MNITQFGNSQDLPSYVVALTIIQSQTTNYGKICNDAQILAVVRDPETNITHPNVVSVPTQRIPEVLSASIQKTSKISDQIGDTFFYERNMSSNELYDGHDPTIFVVESLLCRKLGLAEDLEKNNITFNASLQTSTQGVSYHPNLKPGFGQEEHILMLNILVMLERGVLLIPDKTNSYSHLIWTSAESFLQTVKEKNPMVLRTSLNPIDFCIQGLCIWTTYKLLEYSLEY